MRCKETKILQEQLRNSEELKEFQRIQKGFQLLAFKQTKGLQGRGLSEIHVQFWVSGWSVNYLCSQDKWPLLIY